MFNPIYNTLSAAFFATMCFSLPLYATSDLEATPISYDMVLDIQTHDLAINFGPGPNDIKKKKRHSSRHISEKNFNA